jgi:hypothetical protein
MNPNSATTSGDLIPGPFFHHRGRLSRALATTACLTLLVGAGVACTTGEKSAEPSPAPSERATTTIAAVIPEVTTVVAPPPEPLATVPEVPAIEEPPTTTVAVVEGACRPETAPNGPDEYGVIHTGENICTWGQGLVAHLDGNGFVIPSQNHPVDLAMAEACWSAAGRVYLRTPAVEGWACIGGTP